MLRLLRFTAFIGTFISAVLATAQTQDMNRAAGEARTVKYAAKDIVRVTTRPHFTTLILLPQQERILDFVIGDKDAWVLEGTQNFAYLKPTKPALETSVNLITASGNIYTFYCISTESAQADLKVFLEPSGEKLLSAASGTPRLLPASDVDQLRQAAALEVKAAQEQSDHFRAEYPIHALKFDYRFSKSKKPFRLMAIYHDDRLTYIHSNATEKPAFYEIKDGQPALVNYTLQDGVYAIDHVVDKGYLSIGKHKTTFERQGE
jgi:type IV secretory pathway VirB9-like protein